MKYKKNCFYVCINILFYALCAILLFLLIYPHMSLSFRKKLYYPLFRGLNTENMIIVKGDSDKLIVQGINKKVSFSSSDFKVAGVGINGRVYGRKVGRTIITAKAGNHIYKCKVQIIDINKKKVTIKVGNKTSLKIKGMYGGVKWSSSNNKVVKVSSFGKLTAITKGTAIVTGTVKENQLKCQVTVVP